MWVYEAYPWSKLLLANPSSQDWLKALCAKHLKKCSFWGFFFLGKNVVESVLIRSLCCPQIAPLPTRTCVSGTSTKAWSAASLATAWCWPTLSAAAITVEAGALNATLAHTGTQVNKKGATIMKHPILEIFFFFFLNSNPNPLPDAQRCLLVCAKCTWKQSQTENPIFLLSSSTTNQVSRSSFSLVSGFTIVA